MHGLYCQDKTVLPRVAPKEVNVSKHDFEAMRDAMVSSQLRTTAVSDPRIVAAMQVVAREAFVPPDRQALAYVDVPVPLGGGRSLNPPMVTGRMLNEALLRAEDHVLLIGAATGYCAALLSRLVKSVVALESDEGFAASAKKALEDLNNVTVVTGPLAQGWANHGPYSLILVDGAIESVPDELVTQLNEGGRLVTVWVDQGVSRLSTGIKAAGSVVLRPFAEAEAVSLPGFAQTKGFTF
jgi:protein-L-isoaspartate(D-aspartate) O-methyltransferase